MRRTGWTWCPRRRDIPLPLRTRSPRSPPRIRPQIRPQLRPQLRPRLRPRIRPANRGRCPGGRHLFGHIFGHRAVAAPRGQLILDGDSSSGPIAPPGAGRPADGAPRRIRRRRGPMALRPRRPRRHSRTRPRGQAHRPGRHSRRGRLSGVAGAATPAPPRQHQHEQHQQQQHRDDRQQVPPVPGELLGLRGHRRTTRLVLPGHLQTGQQRRQVRRIGGEGVLCAVPRDLATGELLRDHVAVHGLVAHRRTEFAGGALELVPRGLHGSAHDERAVVGRPEDHRLVGPRRTRRSGWTARYRRQTRWRWGNPGHCRPARPATRYFARMSLSTALAPVAGL